MRGTKNLTAQTIRQLIITVANGIEKLSTETTLNLDAGATQILERSINTGQLEVGDYACVLQALIEEQWETLGYGVFYVDEPPIQIEATFNLGERGRILILLDSGHPDNNEPHGAAPSQTAQQDFLESLLEAIGWNYTLVTDAGAFTRELRTGGYLVYALLSEHDKLAEQVQKELREAVYRGEGLIVAGAHDQRHHLDEVLGIKHKGQSPKALGFTFNHLDETLTTAFAFSNNVLRAELAGATSIGQFQLSPEPNCEQTLRKNNGQGNQDNTESNLRLHLGSHFSPVWGRQKHLCRLRSIGPTPPFSENSPLTQVLTTGSNNLSSETLHPLMRF
ncbi:hypothetical protein BGS_0971 [Beggiatoa sp. SS]|nr:hypothetical protein BGS_0971 [Beggiatoa sp. SS]